MEKSAESLAGALRLWANERDERGGCSPGATDLLRNAATAIEIQDGALAKLQDERDTLADALNNATLALGDG